MKKAKCFIIKGLVQGVGFRYFTFHLANKMGICGYVKNLSNGNVEVYAIGTEIQLIDFEKKLWEGSNYSQVENIEIKNMEIINIHSFEITH